MTATDHRHTEFFGEAIQVQRGRVDACNGLVPPETIIDGIINK